MGCRTLRAPPYIKDNAASNHVASTHGIEESAPMRRAKCIYAILCLSTVAAHFFARGAIADATAGWGEVEITPPLGIGLGGRGGPDTVANKVLDPLFAQVFYLKDAQ